MRDGQFQLAVSMPCHSVPTSPAMSRSTSQRGQPVTPQRLPVHRLQHRYSVSQSLHRSPATPTTPYTPLSLRSFASSCTGASSTLTTPDHLSVSVKRLFASPDVARSTPEAGAKEHRLADIAENWRFRAGGQGVKLAPTLNDLNRGDDASEDPASDSLFLSPEEALLAPFIAKQKRAQPQRQRAHSHVSIPASHLLASPTASRHNAHAYNHPPSPLVARRLNQSQNNVVMSTPPQNRSLAKQFKMKGSFTDPPQPRRRERADSLRTPQHSNKSLDFGLSHDTSLDLFDIDENDFEYDTSNDRNDGGSSPLMDLGFRSEINANHDTNSYAYPEYIPPPLPSLPSYQPHQFVPTHSLAPFADPFQGHALSSIPESIEHYFHAQKLHDNGIYVAPSVLPLQNFQPPSLGPLRPFPHLPNAYPANPSWVPLPALPPIPPLAPFHTLGDPQDLNVRSTPPVDIQTPDGCSVCLTSHPRTLAILLPCRHPLCSACLTSALNIVGEKDMECAVCRGKVQDFCLVAGDENKISVQQKESSERPQSKTDKKISSFEEDGRSFFDPLFSSPQSGMSVELGLEALEGVGAFEFGLTLDGARASTPKIRDDLKDSVKEAGGGPRSTKRETGRVRSEKKGEQNVVLRIDNVPWDITPPQIAKWLQQPVEKVHVLLDKKGKTMSHAYVEVSDVDTAGKILRGEIREEIDPKKLSSGSVRGAKPRERGSILGKGRRARGVTITRSGQEELMTDLFPNWKGGFDGSRPSLAGLNNDRVIGALESGLMGEGEVVAILHLIKEPDSHFLKTPSLPFYSLANILSKFPTDVDSRVFWSASVRDLLYDVTYAAVQVLLSRVVSPAAAPEIEYTPELFVDLAQAALECQAFTDRQRAQVADLVKASSITVPLVAESTMSSSPSSTVHELGTPEGREACGEVKGNIDVHQATDPAGGEVVAELAKEFGVEAQLVQALAERLAALH